VARIIDRLTTRFSYDMPTSELDAPLQSDTSILAWTYQNQNSEGILPLFRNYVTDGYHGNAIVFATILARMQLFTQAELKLQDIKTRKLVDHPSLDMLKHPWPNGTTADLLSRNIQDADLAGQSITAKFADRYVRLRPDFVQIISVPVFEDEREYREVTGYLYSPTGVLSDRTEFYLEQDVAHWTPIPDPIAQWRGMSWLSPVVREVNADHNMTLHKRAFFQNAATPNMLIKYQQQLDPSVLARIKESFQARHQGPNNAWNTAVLDAGADIQIVGNSFSEMAFTALQSAGETRIAAAAGVPPVIIGLSEGLSAATYSNYAQAMRRFADGTMRHLWQSWCAAHEKLLDIPAGYRLWYDTSSIAALREGERDIADAARFWAVAAQQLITAGYDADSVTAALVANDFSVLTHTGAIPTALYPNGQVPTTQGSS